MSDKAGPLLADQELEVISTTGDNSSQRVVAAGGILGAIAASSCCILPLVLTVAGIGGAWMANLRALAPFQPVFIAATVALLGYGFYLVYWKPKRACADGAVCVRPVVSSTIVRSALWLATFIVLLAITFTYWFPPIVPYLP